MDAERRDTGKPRSKMKTTTRQSIIIALAILGLAIIIAIGIGLALGLRPTHRIEIDRVDKIGKNGAKDKDGGKGTKGGKEGEGFKSAFGKYRMAAVESDNEICSQIGMDIMAGRGGSAVDAAIATMLCLGATQFQNAGIGGGHFMVVYDKEKGSGNKTVKTLLAREVFPLAGYRDYFKNHSSTHGGSAVGVPGMIHGLYTAWSLYGHVPWSQLVHPSVKLCEGGFRVHRSLATVIKKRMDRILWANNTNLRDVTLNRDGTPKKEGDIIKRPKLAKTLRIIADDPMSFYNGSLAEEVVADIQEAGGIITKEDLIGYRTRIREPISGQLRSLNLTMYSPEPPSSGIVAQFIFRLLDGFGFDNTSLKDDPTAIETYHKVIESFKFGYGRRSALGDALFWNVSEAVQNMTSEDYVESIRQMIDLNQTRELAYYAHGYVMVEDGGTTHLNVLAPDGSAVAATASINYYFGSEVYGSRTGIMFNNEMDDFSIPGQSNTYGIAPSPSNLPEPGKMPMSSMSPSIFLTADGQVAYMLGASGGSRIIASMVYVALHNLYFKMDLGTATDTPRLHHQLLPHEIQYEPGFDEDVLQGLLQRYHTITKSKVANGNVGTLVNQCLICSVPDGPDKKCIHAVADGREGGGPYGY